MYIGIVNHHFTLFLGAMLEASSAPACLQTFKALHMLRMCRAPGMSLVLVGQDQDRGGVGDDTSTAPDHYKDVCA